MSKYNYLTDDDTKMDSFFVDSQIALGLSYCKTVKDMLELISDVRLHERSLCEKEIADLEAEKRALLYRLNK